VKNSVDSERKSFVVVRHGPIGPAYAGTGRAVKEALRAHPPDPGWAVELRELREWIGPADQPSG
jgi:hypothetical protein